VMCLIGISVGAACWALLEWWYQSHGQSTVDGVIPDGGASIPVDWEQENEGSRTRLILALAVTLGAGVGAIAMFRRQR